MKNRWLYIILAVSLALNLTAIGAFAYRRYRVKQKRLGVFRRLKMMAPGRMDPLLAEHQRQMDSLRVEYWRARQELDRLSFEEKPESGAVEQALERISVIHRDMNRLVYETGRNIQLVLPLEQRERIRRRWCDMIEGPHPHRQPGPGEPYPYRREMHKPRRY